MKRESIYIDIVSYTVISLMAVLMIYPFLHILAVSVSGYAEYLKHPFMFIPTAFDLSNYKALFEDATIFICYKNTIIVTLAGTVLAVFLTIITAYPLSRRELKGKSAIMTFIIITMMFNGGMIPNFFLIKSVGLLDSLWALIIPGSLTAFNIIIMKSFFETLPLELEDAAKIDGASDIRLLFRIFVPLSMPVIATITLFSAVGRWNSFFNAVLYIRDQDKWTLQLYLRELIYASTNTLNNGSANAAEASQIQPMCVNYSAVIIVILPILLVYPFLQKYFTKGMMIGAVKG